MWPFSRKEEIPQSPRIECPVKPGQRFTYLGVTMVAEFETPEMEYWPRTLNASYVNGAGNIVSVRFVPAEYEAIRQEMAR